MSRPRRRRLVGLAAALFAAALVVAAGLAHRTVDTPRQTEPAAPRPSTPAGERDKALHGIVLALDGTGIGGATVVITDAIGRQETRTTADGAFALARHPVGPADVAASAPGFATLSLPSVVALDPLVLSLALTVEVRGKVVDAATGLGLRAQLIVLGGCDSYVALPETPEEANEETHGASLLASGDDGTFTLTVDERGGAVRAFAPDHEQATCTVSMGGPIRIALQRSPPRQLRVVDEEGRPVAGAVVRRQAGYDFPGAAFATLDNGETVLPEVQLRRAFVSAPGFATTAIYLHRLPMASGATWTVTLSRSRTLRGRVLSPEGAGVAGVKVQASCTLPEIRHRTISQWNRTDGAGEFALEVLASATNVAVTTLHADWEGTYTQEHDDRPITIALTSPEPFRLHGVEMPTTAGEEPIVVRAHSPLLPTQWAVLDAEAWPDVPGLLLPENGHWTIDLWARNSAATGLGPGPLQLRPMRIVTGLVIDEDGRPVPGALVKAHERGAVLPHPPLAFSDRRGCFQLVAPPDLCVLHANHPHFGFGGVCTDAANHYRIVLERK